MDNHRLHNYDETEVVVNRRSTAISDLLEPAMHIVADGKEKVNYSDTREKFASNQKELKITLKYHFEKIHKYLEDRETQLLTGLQSMIEKEYMKIQDAEKDFVHLTSKLEATIACAQKLVDGPKSVSLLTEGKQIIWDLEKDIESTENMFIPFSVRGKCLQLVFSEENLLKSSIDKFGAIVDIDGLLFEGNVPAQIESQADSVKPRLTRNISLPTMSSYQMFSDPLCNNESDTCTIQPAAIISCNEKGKNFHPCGIAVGSNNLITVSDLHNNFVKVLTSSGKVIDTIESNRGSQAFKGPCALFVDKNNDIYILERESRSIRKYTNGSLGDLGKFNKQFSDPRGIVMFEDKAYVTDWKNNCIHVMALSNNKLTYQSTIGERYLKQPVGIACDDTNKRIVVSDQENHCVWVLTPDGDMINVIGGEKGNHLGMLNAPYGVAVTGDGKVVVSEKGSSRISVFSLQGSHLFSFGRKGSDPGQFNQLRHVCTNFNKQILVADEMNQRVQIFDI